MSDKELKSEDGWRTFLPQGAGTTSPPSTEIVAHLPRGHADRIAERCENMHVGTPTRYATYPARKWVGYSCHHSNL